MKRYTVNLVRYLFAVILLLSSVGGCSNLQTNTSLYTDIGGKEKLEKVFGLAISRIYNDPILSPHFKGVPKKALRKKLVDQTCELIGGPCQYTGKSMKKAHNERDVTEVEFYRLVEHVQYAMRRMGLSYQQENLILQKLAPLKSDIVYQNGEGNPE